MSEHLSNKTGTGASLAAGLPQGRKRAYGPHRKHSDLIRCIVDIHGAETKNFWRTIEVLSQDEDWFEVAVRRRFRPDAFKIDKATKTVEIHEAVVTHPPSRHALLEMGLFWFDLDCEEWDVRLFLHRQDQVEPTEIGLMHWYLELLRDYNERRASNLLTTRERAS